MNTQKFLAVSLSLLLSSYTLAANAHGKDHQINPPIEASNVPLLEWGSPAFNAAEQLYQTAGGYGCVACHGQFAQGGGNVGGNIRNHSPQQINTALQKQPLMQLLDKALSTEERMQLASYLKTVGEYQLIEWTIESDTSYQKVSFEKDGPKQLVIFNKTFEPMELALESITSGATLTIQPYATESYRWTAKPGIARLQYKQNVLDINIK